MKSDKANDRNKQQQDPLKKQGDLGRQGNLGRKDQPFGSNQRPIKDEWNKDRQKGK